MSDPSRLVIPLVFALIGAGGSAAFFQSDAGASTLALFSDAGATTANVFQASDMFDTLCLEAGPDAYGYTCEVVPYAFEDIRSSGTPITLADNEVSAWIDLGFDFYFYGEKRKQVKVGSNGFISLYENGEQGHGCCSGQSLPNSTKPNGLVAAYWEDLDPSAGGSVTYASLGTGDAQRLIIQFTDVPHAGGGPTVTFQFVLYETTDYAHVVLQSVTSDGGTHTTGIEDKHGSSGLMYRHGSYDIEEINIRFLPP